MEIETNKDKQTWEGLEELLACEVIAQSRRRTRFWFVMCMVSLAVLVGTNAAWIYVAINK